MLELPRSVITAHPILLVKQIFVIATVHNYRELLIWVFLYLFSIIHAKADLKLLLITKLITAAFID